MDIYCADDLLLLDRQKVISELDKIIAPYDMTIQDRHRLIDLADELAEGQTEDPR